jgi:hypothetical protein
LDWFGGIDLRPIGSVLLFKVSDSIFFGLVHIFLPILLKSISTNYLHILLKIFMLLKLFIHRFDAPLSI